MEPTHWNSGAYGENPWIEIPNYAPVFGKKVKRSKLLFYIKEIVKKDWNARTFATFLWWNTGGPCNSRIFGGIEDPRVTKPRLTSNVLVLKS